MTGNLSDYSCSTTVYPRINFFYNWLFKYTSKF